MSEIKTPLLRFENKETNENIYVIKEKHTFADIIRFLLSQGCDKKEMYILAEQEENDLSKRNGRPN